MQQRGSMQTMKSADKILEHESDITQDLVRDLFDYKDGNLYWKNRPSTNKRDAGEKAGCLNGSGYEFIGLNNTRIVTHRLVFLYHHGYLPEFVDHIDGNRSNNNIENLRSATKSQNNCNKSKQSNNTSGTPNLYWDKANKKWQVYVTVNRKKVFSARIADRELAELVASEARRKYHGDFYKEHHA
jgi:hypothetical protein